MKSILIPEKTLPIAILESSSNSVIVEIGGVDSTVEELHRTTKLWRMY